MRRRGASIRHVETRLGIPRSTLSGWFRKIELTSRQQDILRGKYERSLIRARIKAVLWHNAQKDIRLKEAVHAAETTLKQINGSPAILELALAMLYLGEGGKTRSGLSLGNSDPLIVRFYIYALEQLYRVQKNMLRAELHLRADQDERKTKKYWSQAISMPLNRFLYVARDKRTQGRPTYPSYHGVCIILGGNVAIQRKLVYLARAFAERQAQPCAVSSAG